MKYLVSIESLDYARQKNLENKFQYTFVELSKEHSEEFIIIDDETKAKEIEKAIKALEIIDKL